MDSYILKMAVKNAVTKALNGEAERKAAVEEYNKFSKLYSVEFERINKLTSTLAMTTKIIKKYEEMTGHKNAHIMDAIGFFAKKAAMGNKVF